jgi:hypothetical protein
MLKDGVAAFVGYVSANEVMTVMTPRDNAVPPAPASTLYQRFSALKGQYVDTQQGVSLQDAALFTGRLGEQQRRLASRLYDHDSAGGLPLWDTRRHLLVTPEGTFERMETGDQLRPYEFSWQAKEAPYRKILTPLNPALFDFTFQDDQLILSSPPCAVRFVGRAPDGTVICITTIGDDATSTEIYLGSRRSGVGRRQIMPKALTLQPEMETYMVYVGSQNTYLFVRPGADIRRGLPRSMRSDYPTEGLYARYGDAILEVLDPSFITGVDPARGEVYWKGAGK